MRRWLWVALAALLLAPGAVWAQQGAVVQATPQGGAPDGSQPYVQQTPYHALRVQLNLGGVDIGLGQQTKAGSIPVVLPSDQTVAVSGSFSATATATASATPTSISAGAGAALNVDLHSALFTQPAFAGQPVDATHGMPVNCIVGCAGGTASNGADGVATSSTNGQTLAYSYLWNGTTWDRAPGNATNGLRVDIRSAVALAVTGTFWQATQPISAAALPLPSGAAQEAGHLATIDTSTAKSAAAVGVNGSAPPADSVALGANGSGATAGLIRGLITCDQHAKYDASDNGSKTLVSGVSGRKIYVCGYILATGGTATNLKLREGSGADCAGGTPVDVTPAYQLLANATTGFSAAFWNGMATANAGYDLCVNASAGNAHQGEVWFSIL